MSKPTLFIHIGAPKTGTTLLQKQAAQTRKRLRTRGVLYPESCLRGFGHHDLAFMLSGGFPEWATPIDCSLESIENGLAREVKRHKGDILLSSENFFLFPEPEALKASLERIGLAAGRRVSILLYLRRQDDMLESWYNQMVKAQSYAGRIDDLLTEPPPFLNYAAGVETWRAVFGTAAMDVRIYEEAVCGPGGLSGDFWRIIDPASVGEVSASEVANTRLSRELLEIQRLINRLPLSTPEKRGLHREFIAMAEEAKGEGRLLTLAQRKALMERCEAGNRALAEAMFGRSALFPPLPTEDDHAPFTGLSVERAVEAMAMAVLAQRHARS